MLMSNSRTEIEKWLFESSLAKDDQVLTEVWEPVFDADRHLVHTKIGLYWRLFIRPEGFVKRFYHRIYPLPVENILVTRELTLYDGFCTMAVELNIRFQATLKYALNNMDVLQDINEHIKTVYEDLLINLVDKNLLDLSDGAWVQKGVTEIERNISLAVSEMLILQNIQSQTLCTIKPCFEDFPDVELPKENVYLCVLKKNFEINKAKREELYGQDQELEEINLTHKQSRFELLNRDAELERLKQTNEALNKKQLLEEKEQQLKELFEVEQRIHTEQVNHEKTLKEITKEADLQEQQKLEARLRLAEQQTHLELMAHQAKIKAQELDAEIAKHENQQARWRESNDRTQSEQIAFEQRQKQLEFETDIENQKRREQQRLEMQKDSYNNRKESDIYLRREIELLALEKQRLELQLAIKDAKKKEG